MSNNTKETQSPNESGTSSSSMTENSETTTPASGLNVESVGKCLAEKLSFFTQDSSEDEKFNILSSKDLDGIAEYIKTGKCKNIITMAGAGISTAAGIPDFRSPGSGLYHNLQEYKLPHPQAIFELDFFKENPKPFFKLAKELYPGTFRPTISHYFIKLLNEKKVLLRHFTQNIDTLERVALVPDEKLVEAHGTFHLGHCQSCDKEYSQDWMKNIIFEDKIPMCTEKKCDGVVKPDIVFFGENLPSKFYKCLKKDFSKCDLLLILGSSLAVQPFASLVDRVSDNCPRLLINREKVGHRSGLMALMGMDGGMDFDKSANLRDVAWLGDCDEGCQLLADKLGWGSELLELYSKEHARLAEETKTKKVLKKKKTPPITKKL